MTSTQAWIACNRFGLGAKPGEMDAASASPKNWLEAQLRRPERQPPSIARRGSGEDVQQELEDVFTGGQGRRAVARMSQEERQRRFREARQRADEIFAIEVSARAKAAAETSTPFFERLVHFWSNHFTVSVANQQVISIAGAFERDVIRPHVLGSFKDMLIASTRHPAMICYLNNDVSAGPNSRMGQRRDRGLNENLAREILELHTLGVDGGYTQEDVIALAKIITGWTVERPGGRLPGPFRWRAAMHEPGDHVLLGEEFKEDGMDQGYRALEMLADHDSTARFIATKLARHFIDDDPPIRVVTKLESTFRRSRGDLRQMAEALIREVRIWQNPMGKAKNPHDFLAAVMRASAVETNAVEIMQALRNLGQVTFSAPSPAGWADDAAAWIGPDALLRRIEIANAAAQRASRQIDPNALTAELIGPVAHPDTLRWIQAAPSPVEGLTLLLASAEFQRR